MHEFFLFWRKLEGLGAPIGIYWIKKRRLQYKKTKLRNQKRKEENETKSDHYNSSQEFYRNQFIFI
jgi:hypothetical protein